MVYVRVKALQFVFFIRILEEHLTLLQNIYFCLFLDFMEKGMFIEDNWEKIQGLITVQESY